MQLPDPTPVKLSFEDKVRELLANAGQNTSDAVSAVAGKLLLPKPVNAWPAPETQPAPTSKPVHLTPEEQQGLNSMMAKWNLQPATSSALPYQFQSPVLAGTPAATPAPQVLANPPTQQVINGLWSPR